MGLEKYQILSKGVRLLLVQKVCFRNKRDVSASVYLSPSPPTHTVSQCLLVATSLIGHMWAGLAVAARIRTWTTICSGSESLSC